MELPATAMKIVRTVQESGFKIYLVGGAVRDYAMQLIPKDYDFNTNASVGVLSSLFHSTNDYGLKHGTLAVIRGGRMYEITEFRGHKGTPATLEEDLSLRDFTINAMAWDFESETIIDLHGGRKDIERKILNTVGSAADRFREDPHRMIRAARFAAQFDLKIDREISQAAREQSDSLLTVSKERVTEELIKIFSSPNPVKALEYLFETNIILKIFNDLPSFITRERIMVEAHGVRILRSHIWTYRFAYFLYCHTGKQGDGELLKDIGKWLRTWKFSVKNQKLIVRAILCFARLDTIEAGHLSIRRFIVTMEELDWRELYNLYDGDETRKETLNDLMREEISGSPLRTLKDLDINGGALIQRLDIKEGRFIGAILDYLFEYCLEHPEYNKYDLLLKLAEEHYSSIRS